MFKYLVSALAAVAVLSVTLVPIAGPAYAEKKQTEAQKAMHERQKKCGEEWREAKAARKVEKGMTWPKYWSACNKRLKGA